MAKLRGAHCDELTLRAGRWNGQAILFQAVDVKFDGLANEPHGFLASLAHRHTSR